jgi:hypothetical protein
MLREPWWTRIVSFLGYVVEKAEGLMQERSIRERLGVLGVPDVKQGSNGRVFVSVARYILGLEGSADPHRSFATPRVWTLWLESHWYLT